ncbi:hypothetical protein BH23PLA1_BH23PLA1_38630 [soil metagenome]
MKPQTIVVLFLALVFGGSAAMGVRALVNTRAEAAPVDTVSVVVAVTDVPRGATLTSELITTKNVPVDHKHPDAIETVEEAIDRAVNIPLVQGEMVLNAKLATGKGLAALVPTGMRAVTIQTPNIASGVAGFVMPGNRVDVLLTFSGSGSDDQETGGGSTSTILQNLEILAVDQQIDAPAEQNVAAMRSVTLLVTPHQANIVDLGQNKGTLHLALRNPGDIVDSLARSATLNDIRFHREPVTTPWDERAKGVLAALGEALKNAPKPEPEPQVVETPAEPKPQVARRSLVIYRGQEQKSGIEVLGHHNGFPVAGASQPQRMGFGMGPGFPAMDERRPFELDGPQVQAGGAFPGLPY